MGIARLLAPFRHLVLGLAMGDRKIPPGFEPIPGSRSLAVCTTPPPLGDCRSCGFEPHPDCDGQGTVKLGVGFRGCPYRTIHEDQRRTAWDPVKQVQTQAPGYIPLDKRRLPPTT